jgi:hypothetical protein
MGVVWRVIGGDTPFTLHEKRQQQKLNLVAHYHAPRAPDPRLAAG